MYKILLISCFRALRVILGPTGACVYEVSCIDYAKLQLNDNGFFTALKNICKRVFSCRPFL